MSNKIIPSNIILLICSLFFLGCKKTGNTLTTHVTVASGFVQKGPFISGSSVTLYDLRNDLSQTGISFNTQIINHKGAFEFSNVNLTSSYASFKADGYYFNESGNLVSFAPLTLYGLSDVTDISNININLLTHLQKARIEYLVNNGSTFFNARNQAQAEVLRIFGIERNTNSFEKLNIANTGEDNEILLAISTIIQGANMGITSEGILTELCSNIINDIREDGVLNNSAIYLQLLDNTYLLDTQAIRNNVIARYIQMGEDVQIGNFGKYIDSFVQKKSLEITGANIYYPIQPYLNSAPNLLYPNDSVYTTHSFNFMAYVGQGSSLTIKLIDLDFDTNFPSPEHFPHFSIPPIPIIENGHYTYTLSLPMPNNEVVLSTNNRYLIEYYENGVITPSKQKIVRCIY